MKRIRCLIAVVESAPFADAYLAAPGLAVHREVHRGVQNANSRYWYITHIETGRSAMPPGVLLETRREAARLARCLAEEINWARPDPMIGLRSLLYRRDILPIVERFQAGHDPEKAS